MRSIMEKKYKLTRNDDGPHATSKVMINEILSFRLLILKDIKEKLDL